MAESSVVRTKRDIVIAFQDGGANVYTVEKEVGDFSLDIPREADVHVLDRGQISAVPMLRLGDEQPMTASFTAYERDVSSTTDATLMDIGARPSGSYVEQNWASSMGNNSDAFTVSCTMTVDGSSFGEADKTLTLPYSTVRCSRSDGDPNTTSVSLTSYANVYSVT